MTWLLVWALGRALPAPVTRRLITIIIPRALKRGIIDERSLRLNLRAVAPHLSDAELDELLLANVRSYGRYWAELFELASRRRNLLIERVIAHQTSHLQDALAHGRGVVLALPHMANWDLAGAWLAQYQPVVTVAERVTPALLFRAFTRLRTRLGMTVVPLDSGASALTRLRQALDAQAVVCLVADRVIPGSTGVPVRFAGGTAAMPAGPALLAHQTGAPLLPVSLYYEGRAMHVHFHEPIAVDCAAPRREAVPAATQHLADAFSGMLAEHPADWRALQPVWEQVPAHD
ncbi:MAG: phosphatidylinositol mannoside acyltransferase [Actinomycetales bacterium]|nr:phosphatidylinositol mannoside acyltransferase [Actinomycetales bacterium]